MVELRDFADLIDGDLVIRKLKVSAPDEVFVKAVLEASEGVGILFAAGAGELIAAAPRSRAGALDELLFDLAAELAPRLVCQTRDPDASEPAVG